MSKKPEKKYEPIALSSETVEGLKHTADELERGIEAITPLATGGQIGDLEIKSTIKKARIRMIRAKERIRQALVRKRDHRLEHPDMPSPDTDTTDTTGDNKKDELEV